MNSIGMTGIQSDIGEAIAEVAKWEGRILRSVLGAQSKWLTRVRRAAARTLYALALNPREHAIVPQFIETVLVLSIEQGMEWSMAVPRKISVQERTELAPLGEMFLAAADPRAVDRLILDWVRMEKEKKQEPGERDWGLSDEKIAENIGFVLFGKNRTDKRKAGTKKLAPHLQEFAERWGAAQFGLSVATSNLWMRAVLEAWILELEF